ncbi:MAG: hypothetical protein DSZ10_03525 [Sulfurovum sp.]|nr:MAG: hypothetical protein DSZ10_03525 [Sulfurovum sp.]
MSKLKRLPYYFLFALLFILLALQLWTYWLGKPVPTFERYLIKPVPHSIGDLKVRRYKAMHSPHLFTMTVDKAHESPLVAKLVAVCRMQKVSARALPPFLKKVDAEMVEVIKKSPLIYMSKTYDLDDVKKGRFCLLFKDSTNLYVYLNGDL